MRPPLLAERFVEALLPDPATCAAVAGDLHEDFLALAESNGARAARRWYWRQALRSALPFAWMSLGALRWRQAPRIAGAVLAGYLAMAMFVMTTDLALGFVLRSMTWTAIASLALGVCGGATGGYVAARVNRGSPLAAALLLGLASAALSVWLLASFDDGTPLWYRVGLAIIVAPATACGGLIANWRRQRG